MSPPARKAGVGACPSQTPLAKPRHWRGSDPRKAPWSRHVAALRRRGGFHGKARHGCVDQPSVRSTPEAHGGWRGGNAWLHDPACSIPARSPAPQNRPPSSLGTRGWTSRCA